MRTKVFILALIGSLFLSCESDIITTEEEQTNVYPVGVVTSITHFLEQYYEPKLSIPNAETYGYSSQSGRISLGLAVLHQTNKKQILDTLSIDLRLMGGINLIVFHSSANRHITHEYTTINHLEILGFDSNPDMRIIFNDIYGKIKIKTSNIPIDELNSISYTDNNVKKDAFEMVDIGEKQYRTFKVYSDGKVEGGTAWLKWANKEIGYVDWLNKDIKYQLIDKQ